MSGGTKSTPRMNASGEQAFDKRSKLAHRGRRLRFESCKEHRLVLEMARPFAPSTRAMLIFVYGTLRRGEPNHRELAGARFVATAQTAPVYDLVDLGAYPALLEGGVTAVRGELYEVDDGGVERLDDFEDVPALYDRKAVAIPGSPALAYVMRRDIAGPAPVIASGDWRRRRN
jgi:gamma-glutamylcyclotransferase (GGCT)/AIG2-like uncharacterized protein YtfP